MGVKMEWSTLLARDPRLLTILPVDSIWPDPRFPRMDIVLSDQTASVQHMNFTGCGTIYTSGAEFRRRLLNKFARENLSYRPHTLVLLWDKPWTTPRRAEMYALKRYAVPDLATPVPVGKIRACDGRFYHPTMAPLPRFNPVTGLGLKPELAITEDHMYPLPQLLASSWTKVLLAQFICHCLWDMALGRPEHFLFDTPMVDGDSLCDGTVKCNRGPTCEECYGASAETGDTSKSLNGFSTIPRHGEADLLFLFHIRRLHARGDLKDGGSFLVRGTNDRDLLAVLAFPFEPFLADRTWWCKGTNSYGMSAQGLWVKPSLVTGEPVSCHEYVSMRRLVELMSWVQVDRCLAPASSESSLPILVAPTSILLTRLMLMFFYGGDYCECPKGITATALNGTLFEQQIPIVVQLSKTTLGLNVTELHYFIQNASAKSSRCKTRLDKHNLLKCTLDAFYSLCYYTGFYAHRSEIGIAVGPNVVDFCYTGADFSYSERNDLLALFEPLVQPVLANGTSTNPFLVFSYDK